jgi:hypothetical protein
LKIIHRPFRRVIYPCISLIKQSKKIIPIRKTPDDKISKEEQGNNPMQKGSFFTLLILLLMTSCQGTPFFGLFTSPGTQPVTDQNVLFVDDFSNTNSGWDRQRNTDGITDYENGHYLIQIDRPNVDYFANPSKSFTDVRVEVEAYRESGAGDNDYGVICRFQGSNDFYAGLISSDGYYGIFKVKGGEYSILGMDAMNKSSAIQPDSEKNLIRMDCKGQNLTLFVNDIQLDSRQDADFVSGDVGLVAGTYATPGLKVIFNNFVVMPP